MEVPGVEAVSSVLGVCVWMCGVGWGGARRHKYPVKIEFGVPQKEKGTHSRAARVVYDQRDIEAVHLQQVHQEGAIALGIQPHGPHVIRCQSGIHAHRHLGKSLEDAVVEFHEKSRTGQR